MPLAAAMSAREARGSVGNFDGQRKLISWILRRPAGKIVACLPAVRCLSRDDPLSSEWVGAPYVRTYSISRARWS